MSEPRSRALIFLLIVASLIMKLLWIGHKELAHDEPFTVLQAHRSITGLFAILPEENNPPLHFILVHYWSALVPLEAGWLRLPSTLFSAFTIWPLFLLGRYLGNVRIAITASLLYFFSSYHFGFAHEVRAYSLFALLATTSMWLLYRMVHGRNAAWLIVVNILMVYTHFFGWLMIGIQLLCMLSLKEWRGRSAAFLHSLVIVVLAYLPYAYIFLLRLNTSVGEGTWLTPPSPEELYNMVWRWSNVPVAVLCFLGIIIIHCYRTRARDLLTRVGLIWAYVPLFSMFAASLAVPMFLDRYLIYASPGYYLLCAVALDGVLVTDRYRQVPAVVAVVLMAFTFTTWDKSWPVPSKVIQATQALKPSNDTPVFIHPWWYSHTYAWHTDRRLFEEPDSLTDRLQRIGVHPMADLNALADQLQIHNELIIIIAGAGEERRFNTLREELGYSVVQSEIPHEHVFVHHLRKQ